MENKINLGSEFDKDNVLELKTLFNSIKEPIDKIKKINELYKTIKLRNCTPFTTKLLNKVEEGCFLDLYICDSVPDFEYPNNKIRFSKNFSEEELLNYIILKSRVSICDMLRDKNGLNKDCLANLCDSISLIISKECLLKSVSCKRILLSPHLDSKKIGGFYHYFNFITIGNNSYIVDLSYRQFFTYTYSALERIGMPGYSLVLPGIFMVMNESRYKTANELLKKGYIKATDENIKNYMDGFVISYRNGLYYDDMGIVNYSTNYTSNDYKYFLYEGGNSFYDMPYEYMGFNDNNYQMYNKNLIFDLDGNNYLKK